MTDRVVDFREGQWLNRPEVVRQTADEVTLRTAEGGDFWRHTHYGFVHDNGPALLFDGPRPVVAEVRFSGRFES